MKLSIFLPVVLVSGQTGHWDMTPSYNDKDNWPQNGTGMGQLFHTMDQSCKIAYPSVSLKIQQIKKMKIFSKSQKSKLQKNLENVKILIFS